MAVGDIIDKDDYNSIQTIVQRVLGTGSSNTGYGQPVLSTQVSAGQKIRVQEWDNIRNDIINIYRHQNGTIPTLPSAVEAQKIRYDTTDSVWNKFLTEIQSLDNITNRFKIGSGQFATTDISPSPFTSLWKNQLSSTITLTWSTSEQARFYFNSGGKIQISSSRTGGTTSGGSSSIASQNASWSSILTAAGTTIFGGNSPQSGTTPTNAQNYFKLTTSYQTIVSETGSSPYGSNEFRIRARSQLSGRRVQILVEWIDDHTFNIVGPDGVDGTLTLNVSTVDPLFNLVPANNTPVPIQVATASVTAISGT